jgi:transposase
MATRMEFLSDVNHRIRFVYLPKHSSWLNQIEIVFGIIHRKLLRGGNFTSVADLESQLREFMSYYNTTMATHSLGPTRASRCRNNAARVS